MLEGFLLLATAVDEELLVPEMLVCMFHFLRFLQIFNYINSLSFSIEKKVINFQKQKKILKFYGT